MKSSSALKRFWQTQIRPVLVFLAVALPVKSAIADINFVPSGSMKPTILEGDFVFVNKLAYDLKVPFTTWHLAEWSAPERGDVVVLFSPEDETRLVKRLVAVPGDTIELRNNVLWVNGQRAAYQPPKEGVLDYVSKADLARGSFASETVENRTHSMMVYPAVTSPVRTIAPMTLGHDEYFVMGDNRDNSKDSRYFGVVKRDRIVGEAGAVLASFDKPGWWLPRLGRFFTALN